MRLNSIISELGLKNGKAEELTKGISERTKDVTGRENVLHLKLLKIIV